MKRASAMLAIALCIGPVLNSVAASEPPPLRNNPFSRPPAAAVVEPASAGTAARPIPPVFDLRATMVGSRRQLANVGGRILEAGESVSGYTLLAVYEDRAVFSRGENKVTIYVKSGSDDDDE